MRKSPMKMNDCPGLPQFDYRFPPARRYAFAITHRNGKPVMVSLAQLEAFDGLLWVGNGQHAGRISALSQPTISRAAHHVAKSLGLTLQKIRSEWHVTGETHQLAQERQHHQMARLAGTGSLRLEAGAISSRVLADPPLNSWILGRPDAINQPRSLALLHQRVIDAWICTSAQDLPTDLGETEVVELFRTPLQLVASPNHPLAKERALRPADLSQFASVALDCNWFPKSADHLKQHGLWRNPRRLNHYRSHHWEGRTADGHTLAYASPLMLASNPALTALDYELGLEQSLALVVRKDLAKEPPIQALLEEMGRRVVRLQPGRASSPCAA